jgi:hypothetical protein
VNLTRAQIETVAAKAGFTGSALEIAVAIALAESGGNPRAYDPETAAKAPAGEGSVGLWQIFRMEHPEFANADLTDPQVNACAAFLVYYSAPASFEPWATFTEGKYKQFLEPVTPAPAAPEPGGVL